MTAHRPRARTPIRTALFALFVAPMLIAALLVPLEAPVAHAATGAVVRSFGGFMVGAFLTSDGELVYCVEPGADLPSGNQQSARTVTALPAYTSSATESAGFGWNGEVSSGQASGVEMRQMNWLLSTHGQTHDPDTAVSVQLALWMLRGDPGAAAWLDHHLSWVAQHGGQGHIDAAIALASEARTIAQDPGPLLPAGSLQLNPGNSHGTGEISYPAGTQSLGLSGAVFDDESASRTPRSNADPGTASWRAHLHSDGWERYTSVSANAEWSMTRTSWPAELTLHPAEISEQQRLGSMVGPSTETRELQLDPVELRIDNQFFPVLTTRADAQFVERGSGKFVDRVTFAVHEDSAPWAERTGASGAPEFAPVVAEGSLYGPFSHPQEVRAVAPAGAPLAASTTLTADRGPGEYVVAADKEPKESGYYYWVWRIREEAQLDAVRNAELLPAEYDFRDAFGLALEGQVVPTQLRWNTQLQQQLLMLDNIVLEDRLDLSLRAGAWLRDPEGSRIPAKLRLTVYNTENEPERQEQVPDDAHEIARVHLDVSQVAEAIEAEHIALPFETRGWLTVRTCLLEEDQDPAHRGFHEEWCDDFGVPEETAQISVPSVRTQAVPSVGVGGEFHDTAHVTGLVPQGSTIGFTYYMRPTAGAPKFDANWQERRDANGEMLRWTREELAAMTEGERCLAQPVATTQRIQVSTAGQVRSPEITARSAGVGYWVEDLDMPHPETGERYELHRGLCGIANERTVIGALAETGSSAAGLGLLGAAGVLSGALLLAVRLRARGSDSVSNAADSRQAQI